MGPRKCGVVVIADPTEVPEWKAANSARRLEDPLSSSQWSPRVVEYGLERKSETWTR